MDKNLSRGDSNAGHLMQLTNMHKKTNFKKDQLPKVVYNYPPTRAKKVERLTRSLRSLARRTPAPPSRLLCSRCALAAVPVVSVARLQGNIAALRATPLRRPDGRSAAPRRAWRSRMAGFGPDVNARKVQV